MNRASDRSNSAASTRRGFTLLELMIAIVIIGILLTLLLPALSGAKTTANIARVRTEISGIETALTDFKATFGDYPPSRIVLYEEASLNTGWNDAVASWMPEADARASRAIIRRFWPQFNFAINRDINQDGDASDRIVLQGAECLAFFLGGMTATTGAVPGNQPRATPFTFRGFSRNPANPFDAGGSSRVGPFMEFDAARTQLTNLTGASGMLVYLDPLPNQTQPYLYASSYDGRGYVNADVQGTERLTVGVYRQGATPTTAAWKDKSFQLISPGFDTVYGEGGEWNLENGATLLTGTREAERDNITNFHNSTLAPN